MNTNSLQSLVDSLPLLLTLGIIGIMALEWILLVITHRVEKNKEAWVSVFSAGLAFLPQFALNKVVLLVIMFWNYNHRLFDIGLEWYYWLIAWVIYDFSFWLVHFLSHKVRILWCLHNVHHSAKEMKLSVGFRGSLFDVFIIPHTFIWLPLLGFHPFMILIVDAVGKLYGVAVHINESWLPDQKRHWFEKLIITPSAHRVHHSSNHIYLDRNYGETFSIWDRIFGTYQAEMSQEKPVYGILKEVDSENLYDTQSNEFKALWKDIKSAKSPLDKMKYLWMPPGWNHQGTGILAEELRQEAKLKYPEKDL